MAKLDKLPYTKCPRFKGCSANHCPLDPDKDKRITLPGEDVCRLGKARRVRIAAQYPDLLPWGGLWPAELRGKARWEAMSAAEQEAFKARLHGQSGRGPSGEGKDPS